MAKCGTALLLHERLIPLSSETGGSGKNAPGSATSAEILEVKVKADTIEPRRDSYPFLSYSAVPHLHVDRLLSLVSSAWKEASHADRCQLCATSPTLMFDQGGGHPAGSQTWDVKRHDP